MGLFVFACIKPKYKIYVHVYKKEPRDAPSAVRGCADSADICCTNISFVLDELKKKKKKKKKMTWREKVERSPE